MGIEDPTRRAAKMHGMRARKEYPRGKNTALEYGFFANRFVVYLFRGGLRIFESLGARFTFSKG